MAKTKLKRLREVVAKLRGDDGCPWDKQQDHHSMKPYLLEEAYEVIEAIESDNNEAFIEELGDVLLHIVFHAQLAEEQSNFTLDDVIDKITSKLISRHPHVFGNEEVEDAQEVLENWERLKMKEKVERESILDGVPMGMPALIVAQRLQEKAARVGFNWPEVTDVIKKLDEEIDELKEAIDEGDKGKQEEEIGDVLFVLANIAKFLDVSAEIALRETVYKFKNRFQHVERTLKARGRLGKASLKEMDALWNEAKDR